MVGLYVMLSHALHLRHVIFHCMRVEQSSINLYLQVLLLPTIFEQLNERTLYIFGGVNVFSIIVVWALYPESNQRTLEEMNLLFAADSIWNWEAEKYFAMLKEQNPELVQAAERGNSVVGEEVGAVRRGSVGRHMSLNVNAVDVKVNDAEKTEKES